MGLGLLWTIKQINTRNKNVEGGWWENVEQKKMERRK
jgi:hypothetical protein